MDIATTLIFVSLLFSTVECSLFGSDRNDNFNDLCIPQKSFQCSCAPNGTNQNSFRSVDCSNRDIKTLKTPIQFPDDVSAIDFRGNKLIGILEETLFGGANVLSFDLSFNSIDTLAPSFLTTFKSLNKLSLAHNKIWTMNSMAFSGLDNLKSLDLSYNNIQEWDSVLFSKCKNLQDLDLKYNPIINILKEDAFEHLPKLEKLNLENTGITELPAEIFRSNANLKYLYLAGNLFKVVPILALQLAKSLFFLDMSATQLQIIKYQDFAKLKELTVLHLDRIATLKEIQINAFQDLHNLRSFYCNNNYKLEKIDPKSFVNNQTGEVIQLDDFYLRSNSIKTLSYDMLMWNSLKRVEIAENPWKCDCSLKWMVSNEIKAINEEPRCAWPSRLTGKSIRSLALEDFVCSNLFEGDAFLVAILLFMIISTVGFTGMVYLFMNHTNCFHCKYLFRKKQTCYVRVVANKERVDLEWDHSAEP